MHHVCSSDITDPVFISCSTWMKYTKTPNKISQKYFSVDIKLLICLNRLLYIDVSYLKDSYMYIYCILSSLIMIMPLWSQAQILTEVAATKCIILLSSFPLSCLCHPPAVIHQDIMYWWCLVTLLGRVWISNKLWNTDMKICNYFLLSFSEA